MVRLKAGKEHAKILIIQGFNSTMVRLKDDGEELYDIDVEKFQFHNGSIKRLASAAVGVASVVFQFHNGSIKRGTEQIDLLRRNDGFNSTMVRLKGHR